MCGSASAQGAPKILQSLTSDNLQSDSPVYFANFVACRATIRHPPGPFTHT